MKSLTYTASAFFGAEEAAVPHEPKVGLFARLLEGWKAARADQESCMAFAELDATILKDIGVDQDEVARVQSREMFTPRAWLG